MKKVIKMNTTKVFDERLQSEFYDTSSDIHAYGIDYLINHHKEAIKLQLDNLVLTYGIEQVRYILELTDLNIVKKSERKAI